MQLTNYQIYQYAQRLVDIWKQTDLYMPAKLNFYIHKNIKLILSANDEIEKTKLAVASHYGTLDEAKEQYIIPADKIDDVNKELNDLFNLTQELNIHAIKLDDLGNIELTPQQMQALMFMIEE